MNHYPKIHRPTATTLLALAALAVIAVGCAKTAVRKDVDTVQTAAAAASTDTVGGTFTDSRDAKTYRMVRIGKLTWMAENLNFVTDSSACYKNADSNCTKYGRLYNWDDAMKACPAPWRVPSDEDWDSLTVAAGGQRVEDGYGSYYWKFAGKKLKSTTGWVGLDDDGSSVSGNGTDDFGFSALPGGNRWSDGSFHDAGNGGYWWSATENAATYARSRSMYYYDGSVSSVWNYKAHMFSLRCVRDFAAPQKRSNCEPPPQAAPFAAQGAPPIIPPPENPRPPVPIARNVGLVAYRLFQTSLYEPGIATVSE